MMSYRLRPVSRQTECLRRRIKFDILQMKFSLKLHDASDNYPDLLCYAAMPYNIK